MPLQLAVPLRNTRKLVLGQDCQTSLTSSHKQVWEGQTLRASPPNTGLAHKGKRDKGIRGSLPEELPSASDSCFQCSPQ